MIFVLCIAYSYSCILFRLIKSKWLSQEYLKNISEEITEKDEFDTASYGSSYCIDGDYTFAPPVYVQRYMIVRDLLERLGPFKKIVDLGCAELSFFNFLKHLNGIEELLFVDQDKELLEQRCPQLRPILIDYLKPRDVQLVVKVLSGNAATPDDNLSGSGAVVAIELIEHMFPPDLEELPYTLFGIIQPQVVIITTPNIDFNVLFKRNTLRHWDHKFEWTRLQFKDWADHLVVRFPAYSSKIYGIGYGPEGTSQYGACTQMVVFQRNDCLIPVDDFGFKKNAYNVISEIIYPFQEKVEVKLEDEVKYEAEKFILYAIKNETYHVNDRIEIPLKAIMRMVTRHTDSEELLQSVLKTNRWTVEETEPGEKCVILPSSGIPSNSSDSDYMKTDDGTDEIPSDCDELNAMHMNIPFNVDPYDGWSDHEETFTDHLPLQPSPSGLGVGNNETSCQTDCEESSDASHFAIKKDCVQFDCKDVVDKLSISLNDKCNLSSSSSFTLKSTPWASDNLVDKNVHDPMLLETPVGCTNVTLGSTTDSRDGIISEIMLKEKANVTIFQSVNRMNKNCELDDDVLGSSQYGCSCKKYAVQRKICSCLDSEMEGCKSLDFFDFEQKLETESSDVFDESHIPSHSKSKKDVFSVKGSLDLPLESVKLNLNNKYELSSPLVRGKGEAKPQYCFGCDTNECITHHGISKNGSPSAALDLSYAKGNSFCKIGSAGFSGRQDACLFESDIRDGINSDCRDKVEANRGVCINRCLSLQYIKEKEGGLKSNRFSLCCEKDNINICDIFKDGLRAKSCGHSFDEVIDLTRADTAANFDDSCSQSKAGDSGYPNTSDREMDMDLTPEQVDELLSENESSLDEREEDEPEQMGDLGAGAPIQFLDHVENGDVANNNRDGEGNNLDQLELGQPMHFQQLIQEEALEAPLDELPPHHDSDSDIEDKFVSCVSLNCDRLVDESSDIESLTCSRGWLETISPLHSLPLAETNNQTHISADLASSLTSLEVHPSSSDTFESLNQGCQFPSWLLTILVSELGDAYDTDTVLEDHPFNSEQQGSEEPVHSNASILDEDWSEVVVPGDLLGGGEPQSEL